MKKGNRDFPEDTFEIILPQSTQVARFLMADLGLRIRVALVRRNKVMAAEKQKSRSDAAFIYNK